MNWKRIFFGKEYILLSNKKKILGLEISLLLLTLSSILLIVVLLYSFFTIYPFQQSYTKIDFSNLTSEHREIAKKIILEVKPIYIISQRKITFVENINDRCSDCSKVENEMRIVAFNNRRKITVEYSDDEQIIKRRLCHELLHTYIFPPEKNSPDALEERIISDLEEYYPCYNTNGD